MAIKKISQLERLPSSYYIDDATGKLNQSSLSDMLFETSYYMGEVDEPESGTYYRSYNLTLGNLQDVLDIDWLLIWMQKIISGYVELSGTTCFGHPDTKHIDRDACVYWNDSSLSNKVIMYAPLSCNNTTKFYHFTEFHNDIDIRPNVILSCQGESYFDNPIHGIAMSAWWADLAEYYKSDDNYDPGTLLEFGGDEEVTIAKNKCNAVVTSNPGIMLNSNYNDHSVGIALAGKVPIKVIGKVKKFDNIILSDKPGIGIVNTIYGNDKVIGKALESSDIDDIKLVECVTKFNIV